MKAALVLKVFLIDYLNRCVIFLLLPSQSSITSNCLGKKHGEVLLLSICPPINKATTSVFFFTYEARILKRV